MLNKLVRSKIVVLSTVLAAVLASVSATSAFAASATAPAPADSNLSSIWGNQYHELLANRIIYDHFKSHGEEIKSSASPAQYQQYLDQYAAALSRAEAILNSGTPSSTSTIKVNSRFDKSRTAQQDLAEYLHMMRGLRQKLEGS